jgi:hypothetical protein
LRNRPPARIGRLGLAHLVHQNVVLTGPAFGDPCPPHAGSGPRGPQLSSASEDWVAVRDLAATENLCCAYT